MAEFVTLELPEPLMRQAKEIAALTNRRLEDVLVEWIDQAATHSSIESLSNAQVLALCDSQFAEAEQSALSDLLSRNQEGQLNSDEIRQLDELMQLYRRGLVQKARALKVAVSRGLRPALVS
jgi:hypothetical protein